MNKRVHRRTKFYREVLCSTVDGKSSKITAYDISTSGIGLHGLSPMLIGDLLRLEFNLIQNKQKRLVNVAGEVKYIELLEQGYKYGVRFL